MSDEGTSEGTEVTTESAVETEAPAWYEGFEDVSIGTAQNKGWKGPEDVIKSYRELEKFKGANEDQLLRIPDDPDDEDGWSKFYGKLGRPESAEGYKFEMPEGLDVDQEFLSAFKEQAFAVGLNNEKAGKIVEWWNAVQAESTTAAAEQKELDQNTELATLKKEWGTGYDESAELGRRAATHFGVDPETLDQLEDTMGTAKLLKLFKNIGDSISEDKMVSSEPSDRFGYTVEQAKADKEGLMDALMSDPARNALYNEKKGDDYKRMQKIYAFQRANE